MKKLYIKIIKGEIFFDNYNKQAISELKDGDYSMQIKKDRNLKHHQKYWLLMQSLAFHFGNTDDKWHMHFKTMFLPMEEFILPSGKKIMYPSSISFDKLDQIAFEDYYNKIDKFLLDTGYLIEELINTAK